MKIIIQFIFFFFFLMDFAYASGQWVVVNKYTKLWVEQYGTGKPTIVLINGGGDTIDSDWRKIISDLSDKSTVIAYNRVLPPGKALKPQTAKDAIHTLRDLLKILHIKPPYVLVAHSLGGLYGQYFARNFPNEVSGFVMINGNLVTEQYPETVKWISPMLLKIIEESDQQHVTKMKNQLNAMLKIPETKRTSQQSKKILYSLEVLGKKASAREVMDSPPLSNTLALVVLSSGSFSVEKRLQNEFSKTVPRSRFYYFSNSSHYIQNDKPNEVVRIIESVLNRVNLIK